MVSPPCAQRPLRLLHHSPGRQHHVDALAEHQIALNLNPNSSLAHWAYGYALHRAERLHEALHDPALRLSQRDPGLWSYLTLKASTLYQLQQYEEAGPPLTCPGKLVIEDDFPSVLKGVIACLLAKKADRHSRARHP